MMIPMMMLMLMLMMCDAGDGDTDAPLYTPRTSGATNLIIICCCFFAEIEKIKSNIGRREAYVCLIRFIIICNKLGMTG